MAGKFFIGLGVILLIFLGGAVILSKLQQTYGPAIVEPLPTHTATNTAAPPPTFILTPTIMPTGMVTAVATNTVESTIIDPAAVAPTIMSTAVATPLPAIPTLTKPTPLNTPTPTQTPIIPTASPNPSSPEETVTFAVIGDYGFTGPGTHDVAAMVRQWQPDFIITVGDNNYPDGAAATIPDSITQHYGAYIEQNRFYPALGNHDYYTDLARPYFDYFDLPGNERYYDFVWGDIHFFALNSDWQEPDGINANSRQAQWLQEKLAASESPWQIVYFHAPPYVSRAESIVAAMNWPFAAWGADIIFSGHAHVYERLTIDGIPYIVNGVGGHSIYNFDDSPHPASQTRYNRDFGAVLVTGNATELTLRFMNRAGSVIDFYTLIRP